MSRDINADDFRNIPRWIRCKLFHKNYRRRTGEKRIEPPEVLYSVHCDRCGFDDEDAVSFIYMTDDERAEYRRAVNEEK